MKKQRLLMSVLLFLIFNSTLQAASITINTRAIDQGVDNSDFITSWNSQTSAISSSSVSDFYSFRSGRDSISFLSVDFFTEKAGVWEFEAGLDAHYGATVYLDGNKISSRTDDLWWARSWGHMDVVRLLGNNLLAGAHTLDFYWAETCCDGDSSIRFREGGGDWDVLSVENIEAASVPEPLTLWLFAIGFGILFSQSRIIKMSKLEV